MTNSDTDRERLWEAVELANAPSLIPVLVQMTGDTRWLEPPYRPTRSSGLDDHDTGGLDDEILVEVREAAHAAILAWLEGEPLAMPEPTDEMLTRLLSVAMAEPIPDEYAQLIRDELSPERFMSDVEERRVHTKPEDRRIAIIGAGFSGLCAAIALEQLGLDYVIFERREGLGGTWHDNRYPGCAVDTPNHLYSYSFYDHPWSRYFAPREEIAQYLQDAARHFGIEDRIQFGTSVGGASYDEARQVWEITLEPEGEAPRRESVDVLISAVGAFNTPVLPDLPGLERFSGELVHAAAWHEGLDVSGKRVGIVGTGATAMQLAPAIVDEVEHLTIFQRSPQWVAPFERFHAEVPTPVQELLATVPLYARWYRLRLFWTFGDRLHTALQKDATWDRPEIALNPINDGHRRFFTRYIEKELEGRPDLVDICLPSYPPFGKRMLLDNGWFRMLRRQNVDLVADGVAGASGQSLITTGGSQHELDIAIFATGYSVVDFLSTIDLRGRQGRRLSEVWGEAGPEAYLGMMMPSFPNLFVLYGPNAAPGHGGSWIMYAEAQVRYIVRILETMAERRAGAVEVTPDAYKEYTKSVDAEHERMIWTHEGMDTYYRNEQGRVIYANPWRVVDYLDMTREPNLNDLIFEPEISHSPHGAPRSAV